MSKKPKSAKSTKKRTLIHSSSFVSKRVMRSTFTSKFDNDLEVKMHSRYGSITRLTIF